jgi:hypothetical protein
MLCDQSESALLGRPRCGPLCRWRSADGADEESYVYVNAHKVLRFSPAK